MAKAPDSWDQLPNEPKEAFAAFVVYRDLGPTRGVVEAYRQSRGKPGAKQATGTWNGWAKRYRWAPRAAAWDAKIDKTKTEAAVKVAAQQGKRWQETRDEDAKKLHDVGWALITQATYLIRYPVEKKTISQDGKTIVYEAADPVVLTNGGRLAKLGSDMIWEAVQQGLACEESADAPIETTSPDIRVEVVMKEADRILAEWQASKRKQDRPHAGVNGANGANGANGTTRYDPFGPEV